MPMKELHMHYDDETHPSLPLLTGPSVRLRAMEPEDLDILYTLENDDTLWQYGSSNVPYSRYVLRNFIAENRNDIYADGQLRLMIERRNDGQVTGCVDLTNFDARHRRAEIGIVVLAAYQHKGIASETLMLLQQYAATHLGMRQLYAYVASRNTSACILFHRAGFKEVCTLQDWIADADHYTDARLFQKIFAK